MTGLTIFYICLLVPCAVYLLVTLFGGDTDSLCDGDMSVEDLDIPNMHDSFISSWKFSISSLCYFLIGFSAAGLLFEKFGVFASIVAGLVTGIICFFALKSVFNWFISICSVGEVGIPQPEIGDNCVTLNNIGSDDVGLVKIFKKVGVDNHVSRTLTYFAVSRDGSEIKEGTDCVVVQIDGERVIVEPVPENE